MFEQQEQHITNEEEELIRYYENLRDNLKSSICHSIPVDSLCDESDKEEFLSACHEEMEARQNMAIAKQMYDFAVKNKEKKDHIASLKSFSLETENLLKKAENKTISIAGEILEVFCQCQCYNKRYFCSRRFCKMINHGSLDDMFAPYMILTEATPKGLASFSGYGRKRYEKNLVARLLDDRALMKQMLMAGGAKNGNYGQAMYIFTQIQKLSVHAYSADANSIFYNLALATSLEFASTPLDNTNGKNDDDDGYYADRITAFGTNKIPVNPFLRYLHYEEAYLNGELDPAFYKLSAWECRHVINNNASDDQIAWGRAMLRNYRPDIIYTKDYKWRFCEIVKTDVRCNLISQRGVSKSYQQIISEGGKCGPRAWFGQFMTRCFGIPAVEICQSGRTVMSHWTPNGWTICLGKDSRKNLYGVWHQSSWENRNACDFLIEAEARMFSNSACTTAPRVDENGCINNEWEYIKVMRMQWLGCVLGETKSALHLNNNSLWRSLAFMKQKILASSIPCCSTRSHCSDGRSSIITISDSIPSTSSTVSTFTGATENTIDVCHSEPSADLIKRGQVEWGGKEELVVYNNYNSQSIWLKRASASCRVSGIDYDTPFVMERAQSHYDRRGLHSNYIEEDRSIACTTTTTTGRSTFVIPAASCCCSHNNSDNSVLITKSFDNISSRVYDKCNTEDNSPVNAGGRFESKLGCGDAMQIHIKHISAFDYKVIIVPSSSKSNDTNYGNSTNNDVLPCDNISLSLSSSSSSFFSNDNDHNRRKRLYSSKSYCYALTARVVTVHAEQRKCPLYLSIEHHDNDNNNSCTRDKSTKGNANNSCNSSIVSANCSSNNYSRNKKPNDNGRDDDSENIHGQSMLHDYDLSLSLSSSSSSSTHLMTLSSQREWISKVPVSSLLSKSKQEKQNQNQKRQHAKKVQQLQQLQVQQDHHEQPQKDSQCMSMTIPYTAGEWEMTTPVYVILKEGTNILHFSSETDNLGVSIKYFMFDPI